MDSNAVLAIIFIPLFAAIIIAGILTAKKNSKHTIKEGRIVSKTYRGAPLNEIWYRCASRKTSEVRQGYR